MVLPYDDVGEGPPVMLLHAGIADRTMWREHLEPLAAAGHRVVAPDLPGLRPRAGAERARTGSTWRRRSTRLGRRPAALVGNSFGAAVALRVAVVTPEKVSALALFALPDGGVSRRTQLAGGVGRRRMRRSSAATSTPPCS